MSALSVIITLDPQALTLTESFDSRIKSTQNLSRALAATTEHRDLCPARVSPYLPKVPTKPPKGRLKVLVRRKYADTHCFHCFFLVE